MTIETLSTRSGRRARDNEAGTLAIGETDSNIFNCPACARPLGVGAPRCPGCGTRLIAGVQASRALAFLTLGLIVGLVVGGGVMAVAATLTRVEPVVAAAVDPVTSTLPTAAPLVTPAPVLDPGVPSAAISALRQTALVNQRVATDSARLVAALAVAEPSSAEIARTLRSLSSNATFGERIVSDIFEWDAGTAVATDLTTFFATIRSTASDGLRASLRNEAAYVDAARAMLVVIDGLGSVDTAARALAAEADVVLPAVDLPVEDTAAADPAASAAP